MRAADELIGRIVDCSQVPLGKRREIQRELRSHIEDFVIAARQAGRTEDEIEKLALANFGDAGHIAQGFAWVYRHERRRLRALVYAISTVLLASSLLLAILAMQAGLAFGFGTPVMKVLASRHTVIEALDILATVAAYLGLSSLESLFASGRFPKAAFLLTTVLGILMMSCAAAGLHTGFLVYGLFVGIFFRAVQPLVNSKIARVGIVVVCFPLAGLVFTLLRSSVPPVVLWATCISWLAMGVGYHLMTHLAARVDAALENALQRI